MKATPAQICILVLLIATLVIQVFICLMTRRYHAETLAMYTALNVRVTTIEFDKRAHGAMIFQKGENVKR